VWFPLSVEKVNRAADPALVAFVEIARQAHAVMIVRVHFVTLTNKTNNARS
jgi:hypothetical protein